MIEIINYTPNPLTLMGKVASECWGSKPKDYTKVAIDCIESGHSRVLEFPDIIIAISDYSARLIREIYTHIVGTSRLQASTRYINYKDFDYYIPKSIENNEYTCEEYIQFMNNVQQTYKYFIEQGIPKEDIANILPFGMNSKMILKINARALLHMAEVRMCKRALQEFQDFMDELVYAIVNLDEEWKIISNYMKPKCEVYGFCNEKNSCKNK